MPKEEGTKEWGFKRGHIVVLKSDLDDGKKNLKQYLVKEFLEDDKVLCCVRGNETRIFHCSELIKLYPDQ